MVIPKSWICEECLVSPISVQGVVQFQHYRQGIIFTNSNKAFTLFEQKTIYLMLYLMTVNHQQRVSISYLPYHSCSIRLMKALSFFPFSLSSITELFDDCKPLVENIYLIISTTLVHLMKVLNFFPFSFYSIREWLQTQLLLLCKINFCLNSKHLLQDQ